MCCYFFCFCVFIIGLCSALCEYLYLIAVVVLLRTYDCYRSFPKWSPAHASPTKVKVVRICLICVLSANKIDFCPNDIPSIRIHFRYRFRFMTIFINGAVHSHSFFIIIIIITLNLYLICNVDLFFRLALPSNAAYVCIHVNIHVSLFFSAYYY